MIRVDVDLLNDSAQSQPDDTPIMSRRAPTPCFPPVHPFAAVGVFIRNENSATGLQQIFLFRKKFVVSDQRNASNARRCQIDKTGGCL